MFQQELHPPQSDIRTDPANTSINSTGAGSSPIPTPNAAAGGLSRANSLARTRAVATLRRAASARELKRAASQNRHDNSTSPAPPALDTSGASDQHHNLAHSAQDISFGLGAQGVGGGGGSELGAGFGPGGHSDGGANAITALSAAFAASIQAPIPQAPSSDVAAAVSILAAAAAARNGLTINHHHGASHGSNGSIGGGGAFTPTLLQAHQPHLPSSLPITPPIARTPPHLTMPGQSMTSQVARTYAMAKLLGAAGLQMEAEEPVVTAQAQPDPVDLVPTLFRSEGAVADDEREGSVVVDQDADFDAEVDDRYKHQHQPTLRDTHSDLGQPANDEQDHAADEEDSEPEEVLRPSMQYDPEDDRDDFGAERSGETHYALDPYLPEVQVAPNTPDVPVEAFDSTYSPNDPDAMQATTSTYSLQTDPDESSISMVYPPPSEQEVVILMPPQSTGDDVSSASFNHATSPDPIMLQPEADEPLTSVNSLDSPGLLLSATVNQIKSPNEFEEKFLLLFSDTLVIAKPLAPPEGMEGEPRLRAESFMEKPDLDWSFSVERVVHLHRVGLIVHRERAPVSKPHALMPSFVRHFSSNPEGAIEQLISLTGLSRDAKTIAKLLYQTPDLDPQQLCELICSPRRKDVLDAYIGLHAVTGVSIESGLRSFLLGIRFPNDQQSFKAVLISFSKHWVSSNRALIKPGFSSGLAANLIFYIMALNDALHTTESSRQMFSGPRPNYTEEDFLQEFRKLDAFAVLSDRTLGRIFLSVRAEPIQQALGPREGPRLSVRVEKGLPTKLSPHVSSDPITVVIDRPDPDFAVRLYGKDFVFEPPVLSFAKSNTCTFTITAVSLDARSVTFVKIGRRAPHYVAVPPAEGSTETALPKSFNVTIEPRELRHTFTLTIASGDAVKHKITLSAEDAHRKRVITNALKERIDICISKKRARSREAAVAEAAASAAAAAATSSNSGRNREPSPIPPLNPSGAETFSYCEPAAGSFLRRVYNHCTPFTSPSSGLGGSSPYMGAAGSERLKPYVTLTFAQSLDAKIAGVGGKQLILSGQESMLMTHSLRTLHDGILVGAGTAVNDNPQLNARLLPDVPPVERLPRPIVLDTQLRTPPNCKMLLNYQNGTGRQPLLVCARTASGVRAAELEKAGAELVVANCEFDDLLSWRSVLAALARKGITRLMVEGGATVISGLLDSQFVDTLIVTVAPKLIGPQGISHNATLPLAGPSATGERGASEDFNLVTSRQFGRDVVFAWRKKESAPGDVGGMNVESYGVGAGLSHGHGGGAGSISLSGGGHVGFGSGAHHLAPTTMAYATPAPALVPASSPGSGQGGPVLSAVPAPAPIQVPAPVPPPAPSPVPSTTSSSGTGSFLGRLASLRRGNSSARAAAAAATAADRGFRSHQASPSGGGSYHHQHQQQQQQLPPSSRPENGFHAF
ncbi:hypothetical protein CF326_g5842 [Tilletia indica]|nr:hypothetical protein CF326_g5842 [Tilletia indica]